MIFPAAVIRTIENTNKTKLKFRKASKGVLFLHEWK
jgi:hypothetical protein